MNWKAPKIWDGGECWIIGGGPSIWDQFHIPSEVVENVLCGKYQYSALSPYLSCIHDAHVIGVNNAYLLGTWVDFMFFGDCGYYLAHKTRLDAFPGIKVTCCPRFASRTKAAEAQVKYLAKDRDKPKGISNSSYKVSWNSNSGAAAISMAVHFGVKRILLLGFDMCLSKGYSHWHGHHGIPGTKRKTSPPFKRHLMGFPQIAADAKALHVEILNMNPNSEIDCFPRWSVDQLVRT